MHGFTDRRFTADHGAADPGLVAALEAHAHGGGPESDVLARLAASRLLVPVLAVLTEEEPPGDGLRREKTTDMAVATVLGRDGRKALPAFTGLDALRRWRADARPVPVMAEAAAAAALAEEAAAMVVDLAGPAPYVVEGWALVALAEGRPPVPPADDPEVLAALSTCLGAGPVTAAYAGDPQGTGADLTLTLVLRPGLQPDEVDLLTRDIGERLAGAATLRARLPRGLRLRLVPAGEPVTGVRVPAQP